MNNFKVWFCRITKVGIAANVVLAVPALLAPAWVLSLIAGPLPEPLIYARFAAFLVILLSMFYVPAALDPDHYRMVAWSAVLARLSGAIFCASAAIGAHVPLFFGPALIDFTFFVLQAITLTLSVRQQHRLQEA